MVVLFGFLFGCFACFCVLVGCFVLVLALLRSDLCSTFEPPKRDIVNTFANSFNQHNKVRRPGESRMHLPIRSISTTRCDDLARATEAQDEKKRRPGESHRGAGRKKKGVLMVGWHCHYVEPISSP